MSTDPTPVARPFTLLDMFPRYSTYIVSILSFALAIAHAAGWKMDESILLGVAGAFGITLQSAINYTLKALNPPGAETPS